MGVSCKLNMIRWGLPSLHSPFTSNSSPPCCSPSIRGKELDFGSAKLSFVGFSLDENEMLQRDSFRPHTCLSSSPQTVDNDYSDMEMIIGKRAHRGLHDMINDCQPSDKDISIFIRSLQACSGSHYHLLMENIKVLENRITDSDSVKNDILFHLGRLGALELFHACLSRNLADPPASMVSSSLSTFTEDARVNKKTDADSIRNIVCSKKKHERKTRRERRSQMACKKHACDSESSAIHSSEPSSSSIAKRRTAIRKRVMIAKNEADMSRGVKVVAKLERVKAALEKETGTAASLSGWAEAAGIDENLLQSYLHFGWYCRDELIKSGRSLVLYLARNYRGLGIAHEDLIQAGNIGILQGAERFDHTRGFQFSTYVQYWIRKSMSQLVSQHGRGIKVPLNLTTAINRIKKARKSLKRTLGRHPEDAELANQTGLSLDKIKSAEKCLRVVGSIDQKIGSCINVKFLECTPDITMEMPEKIVLREHMKSDINKLLKDLNPKERQILILRYGFKGHCMSLYEIGKIFKVSKEWIRRMERKALTKLKDEENLTSLRHYLEP